ncbi:glycosyltransferase family 4 protein [Helicobacter salomonis]|uniref:glycosyltransferase family 4 protein n=1 Tax=Helicobacter salomonis TaxID=56878 RepID=UPI0039896F2C
MYRYFKTKTGHFLAHCTTFGLLGDFILFVKYRFLWNRNKTLRGKSFDLCIEAGWPIYYIHPVNAKKTLVCIHDLPLCDPQSWFLSKESIALWKHYIYPKMAICTQAICFCEYVKSDILKTFHFSSECVHVIYHGLRTYRVEACESLPPNLGEFILAVGQAKRKNILRLIEAFKLLPQELQGRFKIVLTGTHNDLSESERWYSQQDFIVNLGYVSDALLQTLYANARLLWWGSLAEGFGLPMVEAMRASCVILASNVSCMPEILGDAGIYCNPYNAKDISKQLEIALTDESLRQECIQKGLERAKLFDFNESMQKHLEIIEQML